uniref:Ribonuclease H-like domain-containing protein n=1 Tax=Tanacetum cinerariifolium TaxID=118510 RepID=A0A6L2KSN5_TANCI|nr:ribonuclease H-like domain-containing protein [Tanacetum cinerariifolium]
MLKQGDYKMWRLRIEQYFQAQDYDLWDVIKNGNSFKPVAQTTTNDVSTSTTYIPGPVTTKEKAQKKNDTKARSMLLMALLNEHLMTFNQYKDAKTLFAAIKTRFSENEATKKTQKTLLKQLYKNFSATSTESLDLIFNRLQKIVKGTTSTNLSSQNMAFMSSPSPNSTNEVPTDFRVSTSSPQVSTVNLSDVTVYTFLANQPNGSQLMHEDQEQIHKDDLEEMDLKWQLALLSMRAKRVLRSQENITRNQETIRRAVNVEDTSSKAMVAIDGAGFNWSHIADDEAPTNMAFMAFSDSKTSCVKISNPVKENNDAPLIEDWESEREDDVESLPTIERKTVKPSVDKGDSHKQLEDQRYFDSGCSRHMTGNISYLTDFKEFDGGYVALGEELKVKPQGREDFHQIVDFLNASHIRRHLKLADADGISTLPTTEIFEQLALIGYVTDYDKLIFQKDEAITKEMHDRLGMATTTASSLEAEQARPEMLSNLPNEPPLEEGNTSRSGKKIKHKRRREVVDSSDDEEASLENKDSPKQRRMIEEIYEDENVNLVKSSKQWEAHETTRHRMESDDTEVVDFSTVSPQKDDDEITLAETLMNIKKSATKDKGKAIMQEFEPPKKIKKKKTIQISLGEEIAQSDEGRIAQKNLAQAEQRDDVQAQIQADEDLAQRMLQKERESLSIEERSRLLTEFIYQRKKMLATKRAKEKRNKPPTQAQQELT